MSPVWKPVQDSPCLDRFCHLSHDAQRVMVAIFSDYDSRKRELLQTLTSVNRPVQDARSYYRSIYEARFGPLYPDLQNQSNESSERNQNDPLVENEAIMQSKYTLGDGHDHAINQNYRCSKHFEQTPEILLIAEQEFDKSPSCDSSRYSDSPPIETQGYRFFSQLVNCDAKQDESQEVFPLENAFEMKNNQLAVLNTKANERTSDQKFAKSLDRFVDIHVRSTKRLDDYKSAKETVEERSVNSLEALSIGNTSISSVLKETNFTGQRSDLETNFSEIPAGGFPASQSLFSQDSITDHKTTPRRRIHKTMRTGSDDYHSDLKTNRSEWQSGHTATNDYAIKVQQSHHVADCDKDISNDGETVIEKKKSELGDDCIFVRVSRQSHLKSLKIKDRSKLSNLHTTEVENSIDSIHLEEENPIKDHNEKMEEGYRHIPTPINKSLETECDESPGKPKQKVYDIFKIPSGQKKKQESLFRGETEPVAESVSLNAPKRPPSASKGFTIPVKKVKITDDTKEVRKPSCEVTDVSACSQDIQEQAINYILESSEVLISLIYESGGSQLRDSLFGQQTKKRPGNKKSQDKLQGFACVSRSIPDSVYIFPFVQTDHPFYQINRKFLLKLLKGEARKIGLHVQKTFLEVMKFVEWDVSKVDTCWTVLDPIIALWLLDPDNPVNSFEEVLKALEMPLMSPGDSSLEMVYDDMMLLSVAMEQLNKRLQKKELWDLFVCVEMKLPPLLAALELTKLTISTHILMQFSEILKKKCSKLEKEAHAAAGHSFLLTSPAQLRQVLFEELRLDTKLPSKSRLAKTTVNNQTSTSESVLTQLVPFHPLPGIILEYRQIQKLKSTYVDGILSCIENDCLRTNWDQVAAATGRLTAYQPNVQAIPKIPVTISKYKVNYIAGQESDESIDIYARDAFVSQTGWTLLAADFQQIELRLLAHLADDPVLLKLFNDKAIPDIFNALTAQWLGKSVDAITIVDREQTKRVVYSIMYGVGKEKLAEHLKMNVDQAKAIMTSFLGYCCSIFKRRRLIRNINQSSPVLRAQAERQAVNFCVQGSAADICKAAMIQVVHALSARPELKARLLMQIHDELLLEVQDTDLGQVTTLVKEVMESSEKLCGTVVRLKVPLPVSLSTGKTWGHMNPAE